MHTKSLQVTKSHYNQVKLYLLSLFSCPDAAQLLNNIAKHLSLIDGTVIYLRNQVNKNPKILQCKQPNGVSLCNETVLALSKTRLIFDELRFMRSDLLTEETRNEFLPVDLISYQDDLFNNNKPQPYKKTSFWSYFNIGSYVNMGIILISLGILFKFNLRPILPTFQIRYNH